MTIQKLPPYPPLHARRKISPSQLASLNNIVALTLSQILTTPQDKRDSESCQIFIRNYARDASFQVLQALIWGFRDNPQISSDEEQIQKCTLQLAESMASSLNLQILLDLSICYSKIKGSKARLKGLFAASAADAGGFIHEAIEKDFVPALTLLLSQSSSNQSQGLYGLRKTAHCTLSFLRVSPATFVRHFSHSKRFVLAIAHAYDTSMSSIATSYGGLGALRNAMNRPADAEVDDWERIWVDTKVALIDAFHIILSQLLEDLSSVKSQSLGIEAERTFDIIFALLEQSTSAVAASSTDSIPLTPFLNRSLLADYQQTYSLSRTLAFILRHREEKDARLDVLESAILGLTDPTISDGKEPGALKIVLCSYGMQQGIDYPATRSKQQNSSLPKALTISNDFPALHSMDPKPSKGKGKAKADDPQLDIKVTQVLDVLPDLSADYVRLLLQSDVFKGDLEQVLSALLEGNAPSQDELFEDLGQESSQTPAVTTGYDFSERRNVFDDQEMDLTRITIGKKAVANDLLQDHSFINQMKADILRRAEAILEDDDDNAAGVRGGVVSLGQSNERIIFSPEDELEEAEVLKIKIMGDGEETNESDSEEEEDGRGQETTPETILELAWIRDPELFNRDAVTRRSRAREQLRKDTGWAHEQIEGWKVMLDRNPKMQEKIKEQHEYSGNRLSLSAPFTPAPGPSRGERGGGRVGRGRGRGGRGGSSRGGRTGVSQNSDPANARERSLKDKHKASRANHDRKRGHDKKMARVGTGIPPTS